MIRRLEWLPGQGPPAVGWGWTSRLLYRGFPPPLLPSGARTAHGLTGPLDPCPPNFAGAPALTGDSWVRGNYSSLPSLSPCLGAERVDGSHLYLPFFQRPPFRSPPRLGARCIAGFLPYLPCSFRLLSTSFPTVGRTKEEERRRRGEGEEEERRRRGGEEGVPKPRMAPRRQPPFPRAVLANHFASAGVCNWGDRREIDIYKN